MYAEEDYLMLSGIQHFAFCKRQWAIIHIEQQWAENYRTTAGELMHKKAHEEGSFEKRGDLLIVRGMRIASHVLGVSGQWRGFSESHPALPTFHQENSRCSLKGRSGCGTGLVLR